MKTNFRQFMDQIEAEAQQEGQQALDELEAFKAYFGKQRRCQEELAEQPCLIKAFFDREKQKPIEQRATSCMICCPCSRCNPGRL